MEDANTTSGMNEGGLLGEYLKEKRLEKNFSLEKLSQKTKISVNILKSLELNDYKHLPSAAYIKGFVTSYVKVLGLPLNEAIQKMEFTHQTILGKPFPYLNHTKGMSTPVQVMAPKQTTSPTTPEAEPQKVINSSQSIMANTKSFLPVAILASVILLFIGGYKLISTVVENETTDTKDKDLGPRIESSSALVKNPVKKEVPVAAAATEATSATAAPAAAVEVKPEEVKPVQNYQRVFPTLEFRKQKSKLFFVKTDAPENDDATMISEKARSSMNPSLQNVYIKAVSGNTWLSYKIDEQPIQSVIIAKDADLFLQGSEIRLFLGNVNVTKIFYNNYLIDAPTKTGLKSLIFPEESRSKYALPLFPKAKDDILYTAEDYMKRMKLEEEELEKTKKVD
jgi:cytoskeleton protein RodZ